MFLPFSPFVLVHVQAHYGTWLRARVGATASVLAATSSMSLSSCAESSTAASPRAGASVPTAVDASHRVVGVQVMFRHGARLPLFIATAPHVFKVSVAWWS